jgi:hypothetical protein
VLRLDGAGRILDHDARVVANGGAAHVYVAPGPQREATLGRIREMFGETAGVAAVLGPEDYADLGLPAPADDPTQGDLMLTAADGGTSATMQRRRPPRTPRDTDGVTATCRTTHACWRASSPPAPRIASGRRIGEASHLDVAPTVAAILGLTLPAAERPPLQALLA